ncbi:hypothetical protein BJ165DRAFT_1066438 [Panaeolus papilionaceus]|nr:hypothetical protein BJ165DRAFT_1066438 [Panaeolus papilionaceus]
MPPPPPPKFGQRDLFNDSFLSFLKWNKHPQPAPPMAPLSPESDMHSPLQSISHGNGNGEGYAYNVKGKDDNLAEKKRLLSEGLKLLDAAQDLLERDRHIIGKDATKRFRKQAAKLSKGAPSKSKLPKKQTVEISKFEQDCRTLYQEIENLIKEFAHGLPGNNMHHPPGAVMPASQPPNDRHDDRHLDPHAYNDMMAGHRRDGSESPPPLPIRPPSNKVTFHPVNKRAQESAVELARRQSSRRGPEDPRAHAVDMMRQESSKPSSSSRREEDLVRSSSHRVEPGRSSSKRYDTRDREDDRYKYTDDHKRSDSYKDVISSKC